MADSTSAQPNPSTPVQIQPSNHQVIRSPYLPSAAEPSMILLNTSTVPSPPLPPPNYNSSTPIMAEQSPAQSNLTLLSPNQVYIRLIDASIQSPDLGTIQNVSPPEPYLAQPNCGFVPLPHQDPNQGLNQQQNAIVISVNPDQSPAEPAPPPPPNHSPEHSKKQPTKERKLTTIIRQTLHKKTGVANTAANLSNLLPTGTVLAFQALVPSFSHNGKCNIFNQYLAGFVIAFCAVICFFMSFTDSFISEENKLYYGIATCKGFCVFNYKDRAEEEEKISKRLETYKIQPLDFVHAFGSLFVFLIFAISSPDVLTCFFPETSESDQYSIVVYLPLVAGLLGSCVFTVFQTTRKGLGYT
ncbi:hypothetical protein CJ030_MR8G008697 [Morella rubra]|uniref:Uncharacterized protein n=1 Tax=Morella rubra TaxID=262757 RepID=A0A6A1UPQ2_9ROSI|nr:hypothetical protein CJ030_MR8G008697 [Morella rubra]